MKRHLFVIGLAAFGVAAPAAAQDRARNASCATSTSPTNPAYYTADACEKAIDLFSYMAPQLGTAIAGGSAVLGKGGTLGGPGKFSVGLRLNAVSGSIPRITESNVEPDSGAPQRDTYLTDARPVPMPIVDAAIGIFKGFPLGVTNVGGVDLLVSAAYIPEYKGDEVQVTARDGSLKLGYGASIGLVQESLVSPGVSLSVMRRDLPVMNIRGTAAAVSLPGNEASLTVDDLSVMTTAWRLTASKSLLMFGLHLGAGQDRYETEATVQGTYSDLARTYTSDPIALSSRTTRNNFFGGLTANILLLKLTAEVGMVTGGKVATFNTFDEKADKSRLYGSVGFRVGL